MYTVARAILVEVADRSIGATFVRRRPPRPQRARYLRRAAPIRARMEPPPPPLAALADPRQPGGRDIAPASALDLRPPVNAPAPPRRLRRAKRIMAVLSLERLGVNLLAVILGRLSPE